MHGGMFCSATSWARRCLTVIANQWVPPLTVVVGDDHARRIPGHVEFRARGFVIFTCRQRPANQLEERAARVEQVATVRGATTAAADVKRFPGAFVAPRAAAAAYCSNSATGGARRRTGGAIAIDEVTGSPGPSTKGRLSLRDYLVDRHQKCGPGAGRRANIDDREGFSDNAIDDAAHTGQRRNAPL